MKTRIKKTIPNPEYQRHVDTLRKNNYDHGRDYPYEDRYPEESGKKLPEDGAWIILLMDVHVGRQIDADTYEGIDIPHLSVWYAMPNMTRQSALHQAVIQTRSGAVHVWPHEYNLFSIEKFLPFLGDGFDIHFLAENGAFPEDAMFYIQSRGIGKAEAQMMLLPTLKDPNFCYFTFADDLRAFFPSGAGTPYLHAYNHERRKAAHSRRTA